MKNGTTYIMDFLYDPQGKPLSLRYTAGSTTTSYYYETNLQGDVTKIYKADTSSGSLKMVKMCDYGYNAWGSVIVQDKTSADTQNITSLNPIRYRGYYLDTETGFYYLQSRYYDPEIYRFINADSYASTGQGFLGHNMFAYCRNKPVIYYDKNGQWTVSAGVTGDAAAGFGVTGSYYVTLDSDNNVAIQYSYAPSFGDHQSGMAGILSWSAGVFVSVTDADTYDGPTYTTIGGSAGAGPSVGFDLVSLNSVSDQNAKVNGAQFFIGAGGGFDVHVATQRVKTVSVKKYNSRIAAIGAFLYYSADLKHTAIFLRTRDSILSYVRKRYCMANSAIGRATRRRR